MIEITTNVTKQQIIDALVNAWYSNDKDTLDVIQNVDSDIAEWDFTVKAWLYFDAIIQEELNSDNKYAQELKERIEELRTGK